MYIHVPTDFLRRPSVQSALIAGCMINWLVGAIENNEDLTDFTLEYSEALIMILCLRSRAVASVGPGGGAGPPLLKSWTPLLGPGRDISSKVFKYSKITNFLIKIH